MEESNFEKIEKRLRNIDLPDFELSRHKTVLRQNLLASPFFKKRHVFFDFRLTIPAFSAVSLIVLFVLFGYPHLRFFYQETKAEEILSMAEKAVENLDPKKEIYAFSEEREFTKLSPETPKGTIPTEKSESLAEKQETISSPNQGLEKIELEFNKLREAKEKGEIKFLQYVGEEKTLGLTLKKIRYVDKDNIVTEIKINSQTNLPVEIINWAPEKEINKPEMVRGIFADEEKTAEIKIFENATNIPKK